MFQIHQDVSALTNNDLLSYSVQLARHEDAVGLRLIACLREAERRQLYREVNLTSLWDYATQHLGLSKGNAQMKIDAMRLARDNPIAQEKIESGELSVLNAARVNRFLRQEKKAGKKYDTATQKEVIESVVGLSQSKCEMALLARAPELIPAEKIRPLTETQTEIKMVVNESTLAVLNRLKELLSHQMPQATFGDLFDLLAREKVEVLERQLMGGSRAGAGKKSSGTVSQAQSPTPPSGVKSSVSPGMPGATIRSADSSENSDLNSTSSPPPASKAIPSSASLFVATPRTYISVVDQRWVMARAEGRCELILKDGRRCNSRWRVEIDHWVPLARGGSSHRSNLRALCRNCNLYAATLQVDENVMKKYVSSLR